MSDCFSHKFSTKSLKPSPSSTFKLFLVLKFLRLLWGSTAVEGTTSWECLDVEDAWCSWTSRDPRCAFWVDAWRRSGQSLVSPRPHLWGSSGPCLPLYSPSLAVCPLPGAWGTLSQGLCASDADAVLPYKFFFVLIHSESVNKNTDSIRFLFPQSIFW